MSDLKAGDVISFKGHVGIYLGGGKMIDASSSQGQVRITSSNIQSSSYWTRNFVCGFRIF
jgi:cell wall-associated NlpC family hydrolase